MTSIWELPNVYFQNLLLINNTPDNNLQPQMHICPLPCTPFEQKLAESAYFFEQNLAESAYFHQQYTRQHQTITFNLKCIFVHSHAHPLSKNWLSQHIFKKQIPNWRKWPQFESCQMYIFKIYSSSTIHQTTTFNLKCIFVHSFEQKLA